MEKIKLRVSGNQIEMIEHPAVITAGTVGLAVEFTFDSQWDTLSKIAVFKAGDKVITTDLVGNAHIVPWEVLERPNLWLGIGVYGANADGTVVIPTLWAAVAVIHTGTDPKGDPALDPTLPIWQELLTRVDNTTAQSIGAASIAEVKELNFQLQALDRLAGDIDWKVNHHIDNAYGDNPHNVTCEQIGAATTAELQETADIAKMTADELLEHRDNTENPHEVTCAQVGAAPAGYGLGENSAKAQSWNGHWSSGFYRERKYTPDNPTGSADSSFPMWYGITCVESGGNQTNIAFSRNVSNGLTEARRYKEGNTYGEWEYVNPPMLLDVEYRTTERFLGKPVYTKLMDCGAFTANMQVDYAEYNEQGEEIGWPKCIRCRGWEVLTGSNAINSDMSDRLRFDNSALTLYIDSTGLVGSDVFKCYVQLWYTK